MRIIALFAALAGLILTVGPSVFVFLGHASWSLHARLMFIGMVLWFIFAPIGMKGKRPDQNESD